MGSADHRSGPASRPPLDLLRLAASTSFPSKSIIATEQVSYRMGQISPVASCIVTKAVNSKHEVTNERSDAMTSEPKNRTAVVESAGSTSLTPRGRRTREQLLQAAETVFVRDGFLDAKITDITSAAGVSNGSFYTYFDSKEAILMTLISSAVQAVYEAASAPHEMNPSPQARITYVTREYVRAQKARAGLLGILEQVATFNPAFRAMRRQIREVFRARIEHGLRRLQQEGLVDPALAPRCTAEALTSMVSNFCYVSTVLGEPYDEDVAVATLSTLWIRGLGLSLNEPTG